MLKSIKHFPNVTEGIVVIQNGYWTNKRMAEILLDIGKNAVGWELLQRDLESLELKVTEHNVLPNCFLIEGDARSIYFLGSISNEIDPGGEFTLRLPDGEVIKLN